MHLWLGVGQVTALLNSVGLSHIFGGQLAEGWSSMASTRTVGLHSACALILKHSGQGLFPRCWQDSEREQSLRSLETQAGNWLTLTSDMFC